MWLVQRSFSNKPKATGRFSDFFHKIESYVAIISGPAMEAHGATPYTLRFLEEVADRFGVQAPRHPDHPGGNLGPWPRSSRMM